MLRSRITAAALAGSLLLATAPAAIAGGGSGGGAGGGGNPPTCLPLAMSVAVNHADSGRSGISAVATVRNCTTTTEPLQLNVSVPGSSTVPFRFSAPLQAGGALTMNASPIGSTPSQLHYGQTYNVVGTLTRTGPTPTVVATITTTVTMPPGPVA